MISSWEVSLAPVSLPIFEKWPMNANSFDALRIAAALCVFISYSVGMYGYPEPATPFMEGKLGGLGVAIFFAISGYLVAQSWQRRPSIMTFAQARALRIFPALIVSVGFTVLIGAVVTSLNIQNYFAAVQTWNFVASGIFGLFVLGEYNLPGVFTQGGWGNANASLWTIPYELGCYNFLAITYALSSTNRLQTVVSIALAAALAFATATKVIYGNDFTPET